MDYLNGLKFFREEKGIKISQMKLHDSRLAYTRIEHDKTKLKFDDFLEVINILELSPNEFFKYSAIDSNFDRFKILINQCIANPYDQTLMSELVNNYYNPANIYKKSKKELYYLIAICGNFQEKYTEIETLTTIELVYIFNKITKQSFYSEYDYLIAMNMMTLIDEPMADKLVSCLIPIKYKEKRDNVLIKYASLVLLNVTSICIYNQSYKKAIYYIKLLKDTISIDDNYYLRLSTLYHENIALHFITRDTVHIEKARNVIRLVNELGDTGLGKVFEDELNNLIKNPAYYKKNNKISIVHTRY